MFGHKNTGVKGYIIIDGKEVGETLQCCHCMRHWMVQRGSGVRRGFCVKCGGPTCGKPGCDQCVPAEARMELVEALEVQRSQAVSRLLARYPDLPLVGL
jgi:hypothetical protein